MIKAPCINRFCSETAEFKKGPIKWVSNCPNCGCQFYQSKSAKASVEKYLAEQETINNDDRVDKKEPVVEPEKEPIQKPTDTTETNGDKPDVKPKEKRRLGRFSRGAKHGAE